MSVEFSFTGYFQIRKIKQSPIVGEDNQSRRPVSHRTGLSISTYVVIYQL